MDNLFDILEGTIAEEEAQDDEEETAAFALGIIYAWAEYS